MRRNVGRSSARKTKTTTCRHLHSCAAHLKAFNLQKIKKLGKIKDTKLI